MNNQILGGAVAPPIPPSHAPHAPPLPHAAVLTSHYHYKNSLY
jgi:hypothetical protein